MMQYFILYIFFFGAMLGACSSNNTVPEDVLSPKQMSRVLLDLSLLQEIKNYDMEVLKRNELIPQLYLFKKYDTDSLGLVRSINFYANRPKLMSEIYKDVLRKLNKTKERIEDNSEDSNK